MTRTRLVTIVAIACIALIGSTGCHKRMDDSGTVFDDLSESWSTWWSEDDGVEVRGGGGGDDDNQTASLSVVEVTPSDGADEVNIDTYVTARFSSTLRDSSVNENSFFLIGPSGKLRSTVTATDRSASLRPMERLDHDTRYTAIVRTSVKDRSGNRLGQEEIWNFKTKEQEEPDAVPEKPEDVTATPGDAMVTVNWSPATTADSYDIIYHTSELPAEIRLTDRPVPFVHSNLTNDVTYFYSVIAVNAAGESERSDEVSAMPMAPLAPPDAPHGVIIEAGDAQLELSWDAVDGATSSNLYFSEMSGVTPQNGSPIVNVSNPYIHTSLTNGTTYYYVVTAMNAVGEGLPSVEVNATPVAATQPPQKPTGLVATAFPGQIKLSWSSDTAANNYTIYWGNTPNVHPNGSQIVDVTGNSFEHMNLEGGKRYYYRLVAHNGAGSSVPSDEAEAKLRLASPLNVAAIVNGNNVDVSWDAVVNAMSYRLFWSMTGTIDLNQFIDVPSGTQVSHACGQGMRCFYQVGAVDSDGELGYLLTTMVDAVMPLPAPLNLRKTAEGDGLISLAWEEVTNANAYTIYWSTTAGVTVSSPDHQEVTGAHTGTVTSLVNSTPYYFIVTAKNGNGESVASNEVSGTPIATTPTPQNVQVVTAGDAHVVIAWDQDGLTKHKIYRSSTSPVVIGAQGTYDTTCSGIISQCQVNGLGNAFPIYFVVTALDAQDNESAPSNEVTATPQAAAEIPPVPTNVSAEAGDRSATVSWTGSAEATEYNIYWSTEAGRGTAGTPVTRTASPFQHFSLINGTTYYYVVTAENAQGESGPSDEVHATPLDAIPGVSSAQVQADDGKATIGWEWDDANGAATFNIFWATSPLSATGHGTVPGSTKIEGISNFHYIHEELTNGTTYYYCITAEQDTRESWPYCSQQRLQATPERTSSTLLTPGNVRVQQGSRSDELNVFWDPVPNATRYKIYFDTKLPLMRTAYTGSLVSGSPASLWGLQEDQLYYIQVMALITDGATITDESAPSDIVEATPTAATQAPMAPVVTVQQSGVPTNKALYLTWNPVAAASSYNFYWSDDPSLSIEDGQHAEKSTGVSSPTYFNYTTTGTTYYFIISAVNTIGETPSAVVPFFVDVIGTIPAVPQNVRATAGDEQILIEWDSVNEARWYEIDVLSPLVTTKFLEDTYYMHRNLINDVPWRYRVFAVNQFGERSLTQDEVEATPRTSTSTDVPPAPTEVSVVYANGCIAFSWRPVALADRYLIKSVGLGIDGEPYIDGNGNYVTTTLVTTTSFSYDNYCPTDWTPGSEHIFVIGTKNSVGVEGEDSEMIEITVPE